MSRKNKNGLLQRMWDAVRPSEVEGQWNVRTSFYRKELYKKLYGLFEIECPEHWDKQYMKQVLVQNGYFAILDTNIVGILPLMCTLSGAPNVFRRPTDIVISNSALPNTIYRTIGVNTELVFFDNDREPLNDIVNIYAEKLASCDACIDVNLMNSKVAEIFYCENNAQAETAKKIYDAIAMGQPAVFTKSNNAAVGNTAPFSYSTKNVVQTYIADKIQIEKRAIINEFLTEIGINNANLEKRERLNSEEVNANNEEIGVNVSDWNDNISGCNKKVNAMFPEINFSIKLRYYVDPKESSDTEPSEVDNEQFT